MEVSAKRRLKLVEAGSVIFEDADEDFRSLDFVAKHFEEYVQAPVGSQGTAPERDLSSTPDQGLTRNSLSL